MVLDPPSAFKLYNKYKKPPVVKSYSLAGPISPSNPRIKYKKGMRPHVPIHAKKKSPLMQSVEKFQKEEQVQALRDLAKKPFETIVLFPKPPPQVITPPFTVTSSSHLGVNEDAALPEDVISLRGFSSILKKTPM